MLFKPKMVKDAILASTSILWAGKSFYDSDLVKGYNIYKNHFGVKETPM